jgi:hypothetical protein
MLNFELEMIEEKGLLVDEETMRNYDTWPVFHF